MTTSTAPTTARSTARLPWYPRARGLGAVLLLGLALAGCNTVETREAELDNAQACALVRPDQTPAPETARFYHYRTNVDLGDSVPYTSNASQQSYVGRANRTHRVDGGFSLRTLFVALQILLLIVGGFFALGAALVSPQNARAGLRRRNAVVAAVALALAFGAGYVGGSVVTIDNSTNMELTVALNGQAYRVPAQSFMDVRVGGFSIDAEARGMGQVIERATLYPDDHAGESVVRALWGRGRFAYTVCGINSYSLGTARYRAR
jgi:hypothetical protein